MSKSNPSGPFLGCWRPGKHGGRWPLAPKFKFQQKFCRVGGEVDDAED